MIPAGHTQGVQTPTSIVTIHSLCPLPISLQVIDIQQKRHCYFVEIDYLG